MKSETPVTDFLTDVIWKAPCKPCDSCSGNLPLAGGSICLPSERASSEQHSKRRAPIPPRGPWSLSVLKVSCCWDWICLHFPRIIRYIELHCCNCSFHLFLLIRSDFVKIFHIILKLLCKCYQNANSLTEILSFGRRVF